MPPTDDIYAWLEMQLQAQALPQPLPEWGGGVSKNAGYMPADIGSQATTLNYQQDFMGAAADPLLGMLTGAGGYNPESLQSTYEDDTVVPGDTSGRDRLAKVAAGPPSIEAFIAQSLLDGQTAEQAISAAEASGKIAVPVITDPTDPTKKIRDPNAEAQRQRYLDFATSSWQGLLGDKEEQRTPGKEILHPFVQRMLESGFSDPRQQYTQDYIDPNLGAMRDNLAAMTGNVDAAGAAVKTASTNARSAQRQLGAQPSGTPGQMMGPGGAHAQNAGGFAPVDMFAGYNPATEASNRTHQAASSKETLANSRKQAGRAHATKAHASHDYMKAMYSAKSKSDHLQGSGRTPFMDEYVARVAQLRGG